MQGHSRYAYRFDVQTAQIDTSFLYNDEKNRKEQKRTGKETRARNELIQIL